MILKKYFRRPIDNQQILIYIGFSSKGNDYDEKRNKEAKVYISE